MTAVKVKTLYDFEIKLNEGSITLKPLNEDAQLWISVAVMKPMGLSILMRIKDIESVMIPIEDLERTLRRLMNSGYQVNFIK